jgi:hypothetical protein
MMGETLSAETCAGCSLESASDMLFPFSDRQRVDGIRCMGSITSNNKIRTCRGGKRMMALGFGISGFSCFFVKAITRLSISHTSLKFSEGGRSELDRPGKRRCETPSMILQAKYNALLTTRHDNAIYNF